MNKNYLNPLGRDRCWYYVSCSNYGILQTDALFGLGLQSLILPCACYLAIFGKKLPAYQVSSSTRESEMNQV